MIEPTTIAAPSFSSNPAAMIAIAKEGSALPNGTTGTSRMMVRKTSQTPITRSIAPLVSQLQRGFSQDSMIAEIARHIVHQS